jgi:peptide/nickel transport system permease protein
MRTFVLRRMLQTVPLLLGLSALTFLLLHLAPGDFLSTFMENPAISPESLESMRRRFGLDRPWWQQYLLYLRNLVLHLDLGTSFSRQQPVAVVIGAALGNTLLLSLAAALVTWGLAVPLGVIAAVRRGGWLDRGLSLAAFAWLAVPEVLSGLLLLLLAARTGWFPVGGMHGLDWESLGPLGRAADVARHLVLPALTAGLVPLAGRMRQMRSSLLDVLRLEYVTAARARGLREGAVVGRHALRNALNPMITLFGYTLGSLLSGAFVAEVVFAWPGLGRVTYDALMAQDPYLVMGCVLVASLVLVAGNLVADLLLAASDPRIRHA